MGSQSKVMQINFINLSKLQTTTTNGSKDTGVGLKAEQNFSVNVP